MKAISVRTEVAEGLVGITDRIQAAVAEMGVEMRAVLVYCPHTSAGVTINESADPDVATDVRDALSAIVPEGIRWRHAEGNSPAHLMASMVGSSVTIPVEDGKLKLGRWQGVSLCEFDGPRTREIWLQALS